MAVLMATAIKRHREVSLKEGREKGREEGREEGIAQERKENEKRSKESARIMAQDGLSVAKIAKYLRVDKRTLNAWLAEN